MKSIIFYTICILLTVATGCNNNDKGKGTAFDSSILKINSDSVLRNKSTGFGIIPPAFDAAATMKNLSIYSELKFTTKKVKFNYQDFKDFIDEMDAGYPSKAEDIYLSYGAYTDDDTRRYIKNHNLSNRLFDSIYKMPCLLEGYKLPGSDEFKYIDFGALCPPPNSCNSEFKMSIKNRKKIVTTPDPDDQAANTIAYFNQLYDPSSLSKLTAKVKFNIKDIKFAVDSLDKRYNKGLTSKNIYFAMGAYTIKDAEQYSNRSKYSANEIKNKTCLLFAYYNPDPKIPIDEDHFIYLDFGLLCPPDK